MSDAENSELLPSIKIRLKGVPMNGMSYFQRGVLLPLIGRSSRGVAVEAANEQLWKGVLSARMQWIKLASKFCAQGLGGANRKTWNTRVNCRPVLVDVEPKSLACGFIRICPFCYARKCWREYSHLRSIMFPDGAEHAARGVIGVTRRFHFFVHTPEELAGVISTNLASLRSLRSADKNQRRLQKLDGWFRSAKTWVKLLPDHGIRFVMEIVTMGTSESETGIPVSAFLSTSDNPPKRDGNGLVFERTWYQPRLTEAGFRKWMLRVMRYRKEWLTEDISLAMIYNRCLMDIRFQQFYCGGEFRRRAAQTADDASDA